MTNRLQKIEKAKLIKEIEDSSDVIDWEDVVALSLKNNFDCWYEEEQNRVVFGDVLPEFFVYKEKVVSAVPHTNNYFKNYDLFNVARRYLESQKEKENE